MDSEIRTKHTITIELAPADYWLLRQTTSSAEVVTTMLQAIVEKGIKLDGLPI